MTKLRRLIAQSTKWTDKSADRHRHDFSVHAVVKMRSKGYVRFYDVMKCSTCSSFHCIGKEGNVSGLLKESEVDCSLPVIILERNHFAIGFNDASLIVEKPSI